MESHLDTISIWDVVIFHMGNNRGMGRPNRGVGCEGWGVKGLVGNMGE
jgi:hypothetical protein